MTRNLWLARVAAGIAVLLACSCWALDLGGLFGPGGDSGSGKVAKLEFRLKDGSFIPTSLVWSPDGKYIATSGTQTRLIHIWDVEQRKLVKELELPNPPAGLFHNMSWSPDGRYLATCNSYEASLRIFNTKDWSVAKDFGREDAGACQKPAFSDDGEELTVWGRDLTTFAVKDWHVLRRLKGTTVLKEGKFLKPQADGWDWKFRIRDMAYAPGSHHLVFAGGTYADETHDCPPASRVYTARIWVLQQTDSAIQRSLLVHCSSLGGDDATQLALHPTANRVAVIVPTYVRNGPIEPPIRILDLQNGQALDTALDENSEGFPTSLTYTPDGRYLLVGQNNGNSPAPVYVIDSRSLRVIDAVHAPGRVLAIAAHPKSTSFAAAAIDGLTVWKFVSF